MNHEYNDREDLFAEPEEVVPFAQAYYATEFPNYERQECPPAELLRGIARSNTLPAAELRAHLFKCSECFRTYRSVRMSSRQTAVGRDSWLRGFGVACSRLATGNALSTAAVLCFVLFIVMVCVPVWRGSGTDAPSVALNNPPPESSSPMTTPSTSPAVAPAAIDAPPLSPPTQARDLVAPSRKSEPARPQVSRKKARAARAPQIIDVDLAEDYYLRAEGTGSRQRLINLSRERQRLRLRMPRGSSGGRYMVTVVDVFGKTLLTTTANSDGRTLTVQLDLRLLDKKKYRLCLARGEEAPDCFLIQINEPDQAPVK
ncbi:MAG TPA: hypothetical protein VF656_10795 [Pyrinomonadaceae bacterium]|jgi:hypothetical protein